MPITTVRYSAEFSVNGLKRWISCEATVLKEGDEEKEMDNVINFCYQTFGKQVNPQPTVHEHAQYPLTPAECVKAEKPQTIEQATIAQINEVTDKTVLESFLLITKKYPAIKEAYDKRLKEITTKK